LQLREETPKPQSFSLICEKTKEAQRAGKEQKKDELLFSPHGGNYGIYLQKCLRQAFWGSEEIFHSFSFAAYEEGHDVQREKRYFAGA